MPNKGIFEVTGGVRGATRVKQLLQAYAAIPGAMVAHQQLQKLMLQRTRERFYPRGSKPHAQKSPEGRAWAPISPATVRSRAWRGGNTRSDQALVQNGELRKAIRILQGSDVGESSFASPTGARFSIGIPSNSGVADYAALQNFGGVTPNGKRVRARRFIGVGPADIRAVDLFLASLALRASQGRL